MPYLFLEGLICNKEGAKNHESTFPLLNYDLTNMF